MKQNRSTPMIAILVVTAFLIRLIQIFCAIDFKTGFYKTEFNALGIGLTILAVVFCSGAALLARNTTDIEESGWIISRSTAIFSGVLSISLFYELFAERFVVQGAVWQVILMKLIGFAAAGYFTVFALSRTLNFKMPEILHTIPAFYMIIRIICSFINISSLSLIAENVFLLASYCCALLFFVSYAAYYCADLQEIRSLYTRSVLAFAFCFTTSLSNIIANIVGGYTHISLYSQVVLMALSLFVFGFIYEKFFKAEE
ncbi:MAG: hypothetical protein J6B80_02635 [Clostridia bacterium]|nr:hypothetical protein [Clostridia bacterium]